MSLPITAVGPLKVETNPILMESAAIAGFASDRAAAPASQYAVFIRLSLLSDAIGGLPGWRRFSPLFPFGPFFIGDLFCARIPMRAASTTFGVPQRQNLARTGSCTIIRRRQEWQEL